jgi:hypothetical protein
MKKMKKIEWVLGVVLMLVGANSSAQISVSSASRECTPPAVLVPYPFQALLPSNPSAYERCKKEASVAPVPQKHRCCVKPVLTTPTPRPTETPRPTPFPSGACCKAKPNANPGYDCSLPLLNFGHPQGVAFGYQRCIAANGGASCQWSIQNRECCAPGIPGCGSVSPTPACNPPNTLVAYPFQALLPGNPQEYERCKKEAGASGKPEAYRCCARPAPSPTPTATPACKPPNTLVAYPFQSLIGNPQEYDRCKRESAASGRPETYRCCARPAPSPTPGPSCAAPNVLIPSPFSILATDPDLAPEYDRCKRLSATIPPQLIFIPGQQAYGCCVSLLEACNRGRGLLLNGAVCPRGTTNVFGPIQEKICCKRER